MKKTTLLLLGLMMMTSASAAENEYVPLVREGVVWEYVEYHSREGIDPSSEMTKLYTLEFNGENEKGHMLYRTDHDKQGNAMEPYLVAYVNEEDKVVTLNIDDQLPFYINGYTISFDKIYDFNNNDLYFLPDEAVYFSAQLNCVEEVNSSAFTIEVGTTTRNGYHVNYDVEYDIDLNEFKIIEGIGVDCKYGDLLEPFKSFPTSAEGWPMAGLSAVYENGELVYNGCLYDEAQQLKNYTAITTVAGDRQAQSVRYYNLAGVESAEPQPGISIKVTTWSDGTRTSEKVVR
jgi:hypothetical protein